MIMMRIYRFLLLAGFIFIWVAPLESHPQDRSKSALVSACQRDNDILGEISTIAFALVYEIGELTAVLYEIQDNSRRPIAWMHYGSPTSDEFFEAEGGLQSAAVAREIFLFLTSQPFVLINKWAAIRTVQDLEIVTECSIISEEEQPRTK